jgi:hypothetical protein
MPQSAYGGEAGFAAKISQLDEDSLPRDLLGWKRDKMREENRFATNAFGQTSKIWSYHGDRQRAGILLDYPFPTWHELSECYYGQGWTLDPVTNHTGETPGPAHYVEQRMKKSGLRWGYLVYCQFDSTGRILVPPRRGLSAPIYRQESALRRLLAPSDTPEEGALPIGSVYQFLVFVETFAPMTAHDEANVKARFFSAYQALNRHIAPPYKAP